MENPGFYAIIPANVRYDNELTANAKLLYGEITALCNSKGFCWATNEYFANLYGVSRTSISNWINELVKNEYITLIEEDISEKLKNKNLYGLGYGEEVCEWCGCYTAVLHKHHYPIPKREGGTETVNICPNCHHEFHYSQRCIKLNLSEKEIQKMKETLNSIKQG